LLSHPDNVNGLLVRGRAEVGVIEITLLSLKPLSQVTGAAYITQTDNIHVIVRALYNT